MATIWVCYIDASETLWFGQLIAQHSCASSNVRLSHSRQQDVPSRLRVAVCSAASKSEESRRTIRAAVGALLCDVHAGFAELSARVSNEHREHLAAARRCKEEKLLRSRAACKKQQIVRIGPSLISPHPRHTVRDSTAHLTDMLLGQSACQLRCRAR